MIDIRDDAGKLLMRYDPAKNLVEIQRRNIKTTIDLDQYRKQAEDEEIAAMLQGQYNFWKMMTEHHSKKKESAMSDKVDAVSNDRLVAMIKEELLKLFPDETDMTIDDIPGIMCLTLLKDLISTEMFYRINDPSRSHIDFIRYWDKAPILRQLPIVHESFMTQQSAASVEEELQQLKMALMHRFTQAGSPVTPDDMTLDFCIELMNKVSEDYIRLKSAASAASQGGANGRRPNN